MSRLHLLFGIAAFLVFLFTGKLMRLDFPDKEAIAPEFRMLMRSRHIYILLAALVHIALGVYLRPRPSLWRRALQTFGSVLLFTGTGLLVAAFFHETYAVRGFSDLSRQALYASLAGMIFHLFGGFELQSKNDER